MFRYFDWLAMREMEAWTFNIAAIGSGVAFGVIFGCIILKGLELLP